MSPALELRAAHELVAGIMADVAPENRSRAARLLARASLVALSCFDGEQEASAVAYRIADELATGSRS